MILNTSSIKGAGHGVKALIAELIEGDCACFKVTDSGVYANLDEALVVPKPTRKFKIYCKESRFKFSLHFLSGAINFDPVVT
jgi:hypothetical protein